MDGIMQAPGGPEEDPSGGFKYGGWTAPYADDISSETMQKLMTPADLLLGRKTFDIFSNYWPQHAEFWPGVNEVNKYVLSTTLENSDQVVTQWKNSTVLRNLPEIEKLKKTEGKDLKIWGSSEIVQLLLKNDLVDEMWLMIHPVILGKGKRLFDIEAMPAAFKLTDSTVTPSGIIFAHYERAGEVKTGTVGA
jgi:dihydrofolate reductase